MFMFKITNISVAIGFKSVVSVMSLYEACNIYRSITSLQSTQQNYNYKERKNILKMNEVGLLLPKKRANTSGVGKSNNYYEDTYIPPYSNTH